MTPERTKQILAIDLDKFKSVACEYNSATSEHNFTTISTTPMAMHELFAERAPDRVVIEIGSSAGWIKDLAEAMDIGSRSPTPTTRRGVGFIGGVGMNYSSSASPTPSVQVESGFRRTRVAGDEDKA